MMSKIVFIGGLLLSLALSTVAFSVNSMQKKTVASHTQLLANTAQTVDPHLVLEKKDPSDKTVSATWSEQRLQKFFIRVSSRGIRIISTMSCEKESL
jgi:hypothetical protein